ncbi:ABC transporter ATP-binding protein [Vagococcus lutrae]|uniref:ABC transporter ATP-binding protein n=1 Tax=Vagococcus lutrae TaxID=81947 RepID=A0AAF0BI07_9ENTE|nr:ABC transporter ATP-binding protein [Vagococcus lutrae]RST90992.1 ABC transporter ATP-binding protein [Vagococcus lutrae]UQF23797.1 ABC transporter ATP-binding protein [Vagococcus lutrae]UQF64112.1 ABC transporter ATP-binding protein [Vagococcus lutrae]WCG22476.1 ABC transporter ATP-binding protein [Vagococcus lutrae]
MLEVKDLRVNYGVIESLHGINLTINQGEIVSLVGANGAGKTSLLRAISGLKETSGGDIIFEQEVITSLPAQKIVKKGLSQVPEGRHVFAGLTVKENLQLGAFLQKNQQKNKELIGEIFERFPILKERQHQDAATLSGGEQQMLAMGRALMSQPKLLLLDEPSMGLAPLFIKEIFNIIQEINQLGTTVLLVEQNAKMALSIADRAYVLETGNIVLKGNGQELLESEEVKKAYLGGSSNAG